MPVRHPRRCPELAADTLRAFGRQRIQARGRTPVGVPPSEAGYLDVGARGRLLQRWKLRESRLVAKRSREGYEIKTQRIGAGVDGKGIEKKSEGQLLNRVVRYTESGFEPEADLRHAELIVEQLGLIDGKPVGTAGIDLAVESAAWSDEPEGEELSPEDCTRFRAIAARCKYLQPDRPDIQFAVKECCR